MQIHRNRSIRATLIRTRLYVGTLKRNLTNRRDKSRAQAEKIALAVGHVPTTGGPHEAAPSVIHVWDVGLPRPNGPAADRHRAGDLRRLDELQRALGPFRSPGPGHVQPGGKPEQLVVVAALPDHDQRHLD